MNLLSTRFFHNYFLLRHSGRSSGHSFEHFQTENKQEMYWTSVGV
jgi:hypothetical protein